MDKIILDNMSNLYNFSDDITEGLKKAKSYLLISIREEDEEFLLDVNEEDYISFKYKEGYIEPLYLDENSLECILDQRDVSIINISYKINILRFCIPYSGCIELLTYKMPALDLWKEDIAVIFSNGECSFEIENYDIKDLEQINSIRLDIIEKIKYRFEVINSEVKKYNESLKKEIKRDFKQRKDNILELRKKFFSLGISIRKKDNISSTFAIPNPELRKPINVEKPLVENNNFEPEPTLDTKTYKEILKLIHDVGKEFERLPSLYKDKEEEHLRDHFLMMLSPNFQGSTTGETFNKKGKTDILLRYENTNVFIAECKFWTGKKGFLNTITQLLGYLTWRDSKAAVIMFVSNKDFSSVLNTVENSINEHPKYLKFDNKQDETWLNYTFHINGDRNRQVKLAVMLYHLPN